MGSLVDATELLLIDLPLFIYRIEPDGVYAQGTPVRYVPGHPVSTVAWEAWCEGTGMRDAHRRRER